MVDIWFLSNPERLLRERARIGELQKNAEWLIATEWSLSGTDLCVEAVIRAHSHDYQVRLVYPKLFPVIPAAVRPVGATERWSDHQYGDAGSLCLEWGPDNWHAEVTGAELLESTYRLLDIENPLGEKVDRQAEEIEKIAAPSRHLLTMGQELRGEKVRFLISPGAIAALMSTSTENFGLIGYSLRNRPETMLAIVHSFRSRLTEEDWSDPAMPEYIKSEKSSDIRLGVFFKTSIGAEAISKIDSAAALVALLSDSFAADITLADGKVVLSAVDAKAFPALLILDVDGNPHFLLPLSENKPLEFATVGWEHLSPVNRRPERFEVLKEKTVGIVGVGSLGSKTALSLARVGVSRFFLIDHDVMLPGNAERHALDWDSVGEHKVDALKTTLEKISPGITVSVSRLHLTGQENVALVSTDLNRLGLCDLIIDATAEPEVFNLVAAVKTAFDKPMVWGEVYGGGVGGFIARSRPAIDPGPQTMRLAYLDFCEKNPAPEHLRIVNDYGTQDKEGNILTASDADVAIIAHHLSRIAADTLLSPEVSQYPYSLYLIGLAKDWVFEAPFATIPIATDHIIETKTPDDSPDITEAVAFVAALLGKTRAADSSN